MARQARLKVFRTAIGFHDAYVAASSRKAALAAWGANKDLFASGLAEETTDPEMAKAALARPGEVIRASRGSLHDQLASIPSAGDRKADTDRTPTATAKEKRRSPPRPSRTALNRAEAALDAFTARANDEIERLRARELALKREREELAARHDKERALLEKRLERERAAFHERLARWDEP